MTQLTNGAGFIFESVRGGQEMLRDFSFSANIHNCFSLPSPTSKFCFRCAASCQAPCRCIPRGLSRAGSARESHCQHHDWVKCFSKRSARSFSAWHSEGCSPRWSSGLFSPLHSHTVWGRPDFGYEPASKQKSNLVYDSN